MKTTTETIRKEIWKAARWMTIRQEYALLCRIHRLHLLEIVLPFVTDIWDKMEGNWRYPTTAIIEAEDALEEVLPEVILCTLSGWETCSLRDPWVTPEDRYSPKHLTPAQSRAFKELFGVTWKQFIKLPYREQWELINGKEKKR